ncbi:pyruvate, water dikinase [Gammaproteobacteria bacterium]
MYILQARPETVKSRSQKGVVRYLLQERGPILAEGRSIGQKIGAGNACVLNHLQEMSRFQTGDVLISDMTDPDWEPIMKRAAAIVTNRGGRTCHASIVARELGIPAVVGCIDATQRIQNGTKITVSCAEGDAGYVYAGKLPFEVREEAPIEVMPPLPFKLMVNVADPERVFGLHSLPNAGVGLARLEFIINRNIGVHPKALLDYEQLSQELRSEIDAKMVGYSDPIHFYQEKLSEGIGTIAAAFYPKPVIVRLSDFKSNEYANLIGGKQYEPTEENPMIGFRGASRYLAPAFRACFDMECVALRRVREEWGLTNVEVMVPFVRTVGEAAQVSKLLAENGLKRGEHGLRLIMMCEIPSNALLAEEFLEYFDGFSIGSNDLTQLTLGLDRDSALVADRFDERNPAVKALLSRAIQACRTAGKYVGICGQGPSDHPDFAQWLMDQGISTVSLDPDAIVKTWLLLAKSRTD